MEVDVKYDINTIIIMLFIMELIVVPESVSKFKQDIAWW